MRHQFRALALVCLLAASPAYAGPIETTFYAAEGAYYLDSIDDGLMQFQGSGGRNATTVSNLAYVDTRLDAVNNVDRFARGAMEFDLTSLEGPGQSDAARTRSAILTIQPLFARNLMIEGFPPPTVELWGYAGDGVVTQGDMFSGVLLWQFSPVSNPGNGPGGSDWNPVHLDVTSFVRDLFSDDVFFAGFRLNITGDLSGQRNLLSEFYYGAPTSGLANDGSLEWRPSLSIMRVPEPETLGLLGLGVLGLVFSRRERNRAIR